MEVSKSFAVRGMVQCGEGLRMPHCLLMGGIVHASRLGGMPQRLLIGGIDQNTWSELMAFLCLRLWAAVSPAKTTSDSANRTGNRKAAMMPCCCDFFMKLSSMTASRTDLVQVAGEVHLFLTVRLVVSG